MCCRLATCFFFIEQETAYEVRISDWSSDVCSSYLQVVVRSQPDAKTDGYQGRYARPHMGQAQLQLGGLFCAFGCIEPVCSLFRRIHRSTMGELQGFRPYGAIAAIRDCAINMTGQAQERRTT